MKFWTNPEQEPSSESDANPMRKVKIKSDCVAPHPSRTSQFSTNLPKLFSHGHSKRTCHIKTPWISRNETADVVDGLCHARRGTEACGNRSKPTNVHKSTHLTEFAAKLMTEQRFPGWQILGLDNHLWWKDLHGTQDRTMHPVGSVVCHGLWLYRGTHDLKLSLSSN